jgi:hypothetical protein
MKLKTLSLRRRASSISLMASVAAIAWSASGTAFGHVAFETAESDGVFVAGSVVDLTWVDVIPHQTEAYHLEFYADEDSEPVPMASNIAPTEHSYQWEVPLEPCSACSILVTQDNSGPDYTDRWSITIVAEGEDAQAGETEITPASDDGQAGETEITPASDDGQAGETEIAPAGDDGQAVDPEVAQGDDGQAVDPEVASGDDEQISDPGDDAVQGTPDEPESGLSEEGELGDQVADSEVTDEASATPGGDDVATGAAPQPVAESPNNGSAVATSSAPASPTTEGTMAAGESFESSSGPDENDGFSCSMTSSGSRTPGFPATLGWFALAVMLGLRRSRVARRS